MDVWAYKSRIGKRIFVLCLPRIKALELQIEENTQKGELRFIGEILCDLNYITKLELRDVLESIAIERNS